jgi:hypothetical protein
MIIVAYTADGKEFYFPDVTWETISTKLGKLNYAINDITTMTLTEYLYAVVSVTGKKYFFVDMYNGTDPNKAEDYFSYLVKADDLKNAIEGLQDYEMIEGLTIHTIEPLSHFQHVIE